MLDHRFNKFGVRGFFGQAKVFVFGFLFANNIYRLQTSFLDQSCQFLLGQRFDVVIDLFEINAVFTKQRRQIAAG